MDAEDARQRNFEVAIAFVRETEQQYPDASPHEIANRLRRHTRPSYTEMLFDIATFSRQPHLDNRLDLTVSLAGQVTDFAHFVASLSDQLRLPPWAQWFDAATRWTGKHSSWAGDLGQAVVDYRNRRFSSLDEALAADASFPDLAADVAAVCIGDRLNSPFPPTVSEAIGQFDRRPYEESVRQFLEAELKSEFRGRILWNYSDVLETIGRGVAEFLMFVELKQIAKTRRVDARILEFSERYHPDVEQASAYFATYLKERSHSI
ncbi:hypothetical protein [Baaleninema simplex]|uniref:hypothetical protein n=1 Tax=Baaleninema simplex TaxID=2862350 RepID=UPI0003468EE0|nr:hypothetical protein [Baaleninema simplex]